MVESTPIEERKAIEQTSVALGRIRISALIDDEAEEKKTLAKKTWPKLNDAKVRWCFDGQIRHRLHTDNLRAKATVVDLKRRQDAVGKVRDYP